MKSSRLLALALTSTALFPAVPCHALANIFGYQFTGATFNPTTSAANLVGTPLSYVNANPGLPPLNNPPFIVNGGILPDDPPFFVGQADWYPTGLGFNENYYAFHVSSVPGFSFSAAALNFLANSRQQAPFLMQIQYSSSPTFSNPVNFDNAQFNIPTAEVWTSFSASDNPITNGSGTYYFRIYGQFDPSGNGTISDLLNLGNIALLGSVQAAATTPMYWDPGKVGAPGSGGSGNWLTTNSWADGAIDYTWSNTLGEIPNFAGASGGTVDIGGLITATSGINFLTGGYTLTGAATSTLTVGGTINTAADAAISANLTTAGPGTLTKSGAGTLTIAGNANFASGTSLSVTAGTLVVASGGFVTANGAAQTVATNAGNNATLTVQGSGEFHSNNALILANAGATATFNIQDIADVGVASLIVGNGGNATVNQNGGVINVATVTLAASNAASVATYNLSAGGTLATGSVTGVTGNSTFNFNGGVLQAASDIPTLFNGISHVLIQNGGATIDTAGFNVTLSRSLLPAPASTGGLTKNGLGNLTLININPFTGPVNINGGTLIADAHSADGTFSATSAINVNATGTLQLGSDPNNDNALGYPNQPTLFINAGGTLTSAATTAHNLGIVHLSGGTITGTPTPQAPYADFTFNSTVFGDGTGVTSTIAAPAGVNLRGNITFSVGDAASQLNISSILGNEIGAIGGILKSGNGTLLLSANNTYTGPTSVTAGTLRVTGAPLTTSSINISSGAVFEFNCSVRQLETPTTLTGNGTFRKTGNGSLAFGGFGTVNVAFSPGALIDIQAGKIEGSSSYGGNWSANQASLNIASGATLDTIEAGFSAQIQIDALTGNGTLTGGYFGNTDGISTVSLGVANGSGNFTGTILDDASASLALVKSGNGTQSFSGNNSYTGGTSITGGTLVLASTSAAGAGPLAIHSAGIAQLQPGLANAVKLDGVTLDGSTGNWGGKLDITNDLLIVQPTASHAAAFANLVNQAAYAATHANAAGLFASGVTAGKTFIVLDNAVVGLTTFGNVSVDANSILALAAYPGDANLDGKVNITDLNIVGSHWQSAGVGLPQGDFNGDGKVTILDLNILASKWQAGVGASFEPLIIASAPVPEPAFLPALAIALTLLATRCRATPSAKTSSH